MSTVSEEEEYAYRQLPELRAAEPWLQGKAERFASKWFHGEPDHVERATQDLKNLLRVLYCEGFADRMKSEVSEIKTESPARKRTTRRKK